MFQFSGESILTYSDELLEKQHRFIMTLNIQKKVLRETLAFSNMLYIDLEHPDGMDRFSVDYALTDPLHIICGITYFFGDGDQGVFAQFKKNSQIWTTVKYSF